LRAESYAYTAVLLVHVLPAAGALVSDILGARIVAQVLGNLGTVGLHEEEVGSQGALGRIGVGGCALALLGAAGLGLGSGAAGAAGEVSTSEGGTEGELDCGAFTVGDALHVLYVGLA
jgi:hypothetical protein